MAQTGLVELTTQPEAEPSRRDEPRRGELRIYFGAAPGVGKTFFGVILAAISNARFARIQGRADLQPT